MKAKKDLWVASQLSKVWKVSWRWTRHSLIRSRICLSSSGRALRTSTSDLKSHFLSIASNLRWWWQRLMRLKRPLWPTMEAIAALKSTPTSHCSPCARPCLQTPGEICSTGIAHWAKCLHHRSLRAKVTLTTRLILWLSRCSPCSTALAKSRCPRPKPSTASSKTVAWRHMNRFQLRTKILSPSSSSSANSPPSTSLPSPINMAAWAISTTNLRLPSSSIPIILMNYARMTGLTICLGFSRACLMTLGWPRSKRRTPTGFTIQNNSEPSSSLRLQSKRATESRPRVAKTSKIERNKIKQFSEFKMQHALSLPSIVFIYDDHG